MTARITGIDPTGSSLDRTARCPASAALPQVFDAGPSAARDRGTAIHKYLERVGELGRLDALAEVDERWRPVCEGVELATLPVKLSREVAVAYNWRDDTARLLQPLEPRLYEIDPTFETALTLDTVGVGNGIVYVGDYKGPYVWLPEPEQSMQLGVGALAVARIHDVEAAQVEYIRIRDDGTTRRFGARLDVFGLEATAERVQRTMAVVAKMREAISAGETPNVTEGPWCKYCPARHHCPTKTALIRAAAAQPAPISLREPLTPATAAHVYVQLKRWKEAFAMVEGALYAYAKDTALQLATEEDGTEVWFGEFSREGNEAIDGRVAHEVLSERYGHEAADKAVTMEATKKAITELVRKHKPLDASLKGEQEAVYDAIKERGGVSRPMTTTTTEYTVSPDGEQKQHRRRKAG